MASDVTSFGDCLGSVTQSVNERVIAFLFYRSQMSDIPEASIKEISNDFVLAGFPSPNLTRLKKSISKDKRTTKVGVEKWRIRSDEMDKLRTKYAQCLGGGQKKATPTDSVIPVDITKGSRDYIEEVVRQINGCYDCGFFDASGVMVRRLVETLIIELFESKGIESKIRDLDGNYFMLEKLINETLKEGTLIFGRNSKKGLNDAKWLGDQSAHNRRFIAVQADIDRIQPNIRILVQEMLSMSGLKK